MDMAMYRYAMRSLVDHLRELQAKVYQMSPCYAGDLLKQSARIVYCQVCGQDEGLPGTSFSIS